MINQNLKILFFCYNQAKSHVILSQIIDNVRNAFYIQSVHRKCELFSFMVVRAGINQEETESSDLKKEAVCRILRFWFIMKI